VNKSSYALLEDDPVVRTIFAPTDDEVAKMDILSNEVSMQILEDLWLAVKAA
jgi:hypothetical protein